jgi:hypothetical protein
MRVDEAVPILQFKLHGVVLQGVSEGWREYLVYLEDRFAQMAGFSPIANTVDLKSYLTQFYVGGSWILYQYQGSATGGRYRS